ncbi:MAG: ribonuclease VapC [Melioribacteraceae bacterium]|nr:MAG: ribonuclease VapC [Melioribacteraceae bacterium]
MGNSKILVDTSVIIEFLRKQKKNESLLWKLKEDHSLIYISSITVFELFAGATDEQKRQDIFSLLNWLEPLPFTEELGELAGGLYIQLKKINKKIEFRDLFIGATSIFYNLELFTLNKKHFQNIPDIHLSKEV